MKFLTNMSLILFLIVSITSAQYRWEKFTSPPGGNVEAIGVASNGDIFVAQRHTGVFYTSDFGETWHSTGSEINNEYIYEIAIDSDDRIYIGGYGFNVHYTDDYGATWIEFKEPYFFDTFALGINFNDDLFVGMADSPQMLYRFDKSINSWNNLSDSIGRSQVFDIVFDKNHNLYSACATEGIKYSKNNGDTWESFGPSNYFLEAIVVDSNNNLFAGGSFATDWSDYRAVILNKNDSSNNWIEKYSLPQTSVETMDIRKNGEIYSGTKDRGILRSIDNGETWERFNNGIMDYTVWDIQSHPNGSMLAGSGGSGCFILKPDSSKWESIGPYNPWVIKILFVENNIYCQTSSGLFHFNDSWKIVLPDPDFLLKGVYIDHNLNLIYYLDGDGLYFLDRFENESRKILNTSTLQYYFCSDTLKNNTYFTIDKKIHFYKDTPNEISAIPFEAEKQINDFIFTCDSSLLAIYDNNLFYITISGDTSSVTPKIIDKRIGTLTASNERSNLFCSVESTSLYQSSDYGLNWTENENYPKSYSIVDIKIDSRNYIYVLTGDQKIHYSTNNGIDWVLLDIEPDNNYLLHINLDHNDNLYSGTANNGIQKLSDVVSSIQDRDKIGLPSQIYLSQNYPNPFNPETRIEYSIMSNVKSTSAYKGEKSNIVLKVYDLLGREIAVLVNQQQSAGVYSVDFNGRNLPSGIYLYKLNVGEFSETKKMVLLK